MSTICVPSILAAEPQGRANQACTSTQLYALLNGMRAGLLSFDSALGVLVVNDRMGSILEIAPMVLRRCVTVMDVLEASTQLASVTVQQIHEACLAAVQDSAPKPDLAFSSACGRRSFLLQLSRIGDEQWVGNLEETTAQRLAEAQALQQALRDPLTGLCNRALFQERVNVAVSNSTESVLGHSVMLVDLDRFKAVNDTLGHPIGDALLRLVAKRLLSVVRKHDVVARLGGDEFALLISPTLDLDALAVLARRLIDVLGRPYLVDGHLVNVGASIGIAVSPREGLHYEALMRNADLALYASKNGGRNIFSFFEPDMDSRAMARRTLEIDLRKALALREFELHYQPQVDLGSNAVVGFEALLRWRHPERGLVSPTDFIPLAEEIGLIVPLGEWVMRKACVEAMQWPDEVSVAVNVSPRQFEDCGRLVDMVARALAASGLPGTRLEVEITESVLLGNEAGVLDALHRIRMMGVRVAMDDFGTGYSSLSQLSSFPFDKIKIDRSFVTNGDAAGGHDAIIRAITTLGLSLGMSTIAEGVETSDQLARIRTEGCTSVQGYLFSKPIPSAEVNALIADFATRRTVAALPDMKGSPL